MGDLDGFPNSLGASQLRKFSHKDFDFHKLASLASKRGTEPRHILECGEGKGSFHLLDRMPPHLRRC